MEVLIILMIFFVLGVCFGSFANVLIDRLPFGESPWRGRSHCDHCKKTLQSIDLIPLFSFLMIGGKCRYCHKKLSWQYPLVEFLTGLLFSLIMYAAFLSTSVHSSTFYLETIALFVCIFSFWVIFITDLKYQLIPDELILSAALGSLALLVVRGGSLVVWTYHGLSAFGVLLFFAAIYVITKKRGIGFGDVKLAPVLGLFLGFPNTIVGMYVAFLTGAFVSTILIVSRRKKWGQKIAFGPFLIFGTVIAYAFGASMMEWYLSFF